MKKIFETVIKTIGRMDARILKKYSDEMKDIHRSYENYVKSIDQSMIDMHNCTWYCYGDVMNQRSMASNAHDTVIHEIVEAEKNIQTARTQITNSSITVLCNQNELSTINKTLDVYEGDLLRMRANTDAELFRLYAYSELILRKLDYEDTYAAFIYNNEDRIWHKSIRCTAPRSVEDIVGYDTEAGDMI